MSKSTVKNREARLKGLAMAMSGANKEVTLDTVMGYAVHDEENKGLVTLDAILSQDKDGMDLAEIMAAGVAQAQTNGFAVTADAVDLAISTANMIADTKMVSMDGVNSVDGSGVIATATAFNQYVILNSNIPGLDGNIGDMEAVKAGDKSNIKFKLYSFNPEVTNGMGAIGDGTILTPKNVSLPMAFATRDLVMTKADTVLSYTFDVKKKDTDTENYKIGKGVTELIIGDTGIALNDYEASAQETKPKREITLPSNNKQVSLVVDYAAGTATVTLEDNATLENGTKLYLSTSLSAEKIGDIRGYAGSNIQDFTYVAHPVTIGTKASMLDIRQVQQQVKHALLPVGLQVAGQKIASELIAKKIDFATKFSTRSGTPLDLTTNTGLATTNEAYKLFTVAIDRTAVEILEESMLTDNVIVIGGKDLVNAFGMLAKNTDGLNIRDTNNANTFKFLGYLDSKYPAYYDPRHDDNYPLVAEDGAVSGTAADNVYGTVQIVGTPADPAKRAVITGVGLPIIPVDLKINDDSEQKIALEGKMIVAANKDPHARKLCKSILIKTH